MIRIILTIYIAKILVTSFEYRESNPSFLFPYYYAIDDYSTGSVSNPAYLPYLKYSYISAAYSRPYSMGEISASSTRLGCGNGRAGYQVSWSRFGIDEYREDILECNTGYRPMRYLLTGLGITGYQLYVRTDNLSFKRSLFDFRASFVLIPFKWINLGFHQENINSLIDEQREDILYPSSSFGIMLKPTRGISMLWNINRMYYGYINGFSISINLLQCLNLRVGYSRDTSTYAASVVFLYKLINVSYGLRHHPFLGSTHCFGVSLSSRALSLERVIYSKRLSAMRSSVAVQKIDINACSADDLKQISFLSEDVAERIIKYRNVIGPISKKSLFQVGMSSREVKRLNKYIYGFASNSANEQFVKREKPLRSRSKYRRGVTLKRRRELFRKLIESGIKASVALRVCEFAGKSKKRSLIDIINGLPEISKNNKELILKICTDTL
jgi:hypothetical protein